MITIFNRKELIISTDMDCQSKVRSILAGAKIDYYIQTRNLQSSSVVGAPRGMTGTYGIDPKYSYEYRIYVKKKEYDKARFLLGKEGIATSYND